MSNVSKRRKEGSRAKIKSVGDHKEFLNRITKTLYYGQLPILPCLSLPLTEISCVLWSEAQRGRSLRRLHADAAAGIARSACVSPCALVLAILYLERLNACNPEYLATAAPNELFLVSLMVGNKFLQDDGEDDDTMCSEWAASADLELDHLKKLEVEFLDAIDWNVFVSDKSFAAGLLWLERQVALKQAHLRGFFTYSDLAATCDAAPFAGLLKAAAATWFTLTLGYVTGLVTFLTSTLLVSHAWLPALGVAARTSVAPLHTNITHSVRPDLHYASNASQPPQERAQALDLAQRAVDEQKCCNEWVKYQESTDTKKSWYDTILVDEWKYLEPWWSKTSVLNWLYQSSLVDPMQRWLEMINEYAGIHVHRIPQTALEPRMFDNDPPDDSVDGKCNAYISTSLNQRCVLQWLNLSKLGALVASISDR